jgi:sucrose 6(F)-phosphate phosphorylase
MSMKIQNKVQLITYPDSLGGDLTRLNYVLEYYFHGLFDGGIHILPPFTSSGDRGFAPLTYSEIEPKFGGWDDIKKIGDFSPILLDLMVNHISARSSFFQDFLEKGRKSKFSDLFITLDKIWPDGIPLQEDIDKIFLRRTEPFSEFSIRRTREVERVWTTFGKTTPSEQIDLDINSPITRELLTSFLANFSNNNVKMVRLDAVGYVIKKRGTTCFFVEPEIYEFLDWISNLSHSMDIVLLPEIHAENKIQFALANKGYWIYDFILPYTILDAFINKTFKRLKEYLNNRPHNQFTMLDCHDGVPLKPDLNGLYRQEDAEKVVDTCLKRGANLSYIISSTHQDTNGFNVHQIRCSYYSMLDCNDIAYLAARAIQFFTPGIPQVYYVGLLVGKNDIDTVNNTGEGRDINRHNFSLEEIDREIKKDAVKKLIELIRFRNMHAAFNGEFNVGICEEKEIILTWNKGNLFTKLVVELDPLSATVTYNEPGDTDIKTINL